MGRAPMETRTITDRVDASTSSWGPSAIRYMAALLWLSNAGWKVPPSFGDSGGGCRGLCRYVQYGIDYPVFPGSAWFMETVVQPNFALFGWMTLVVEAGLAAVLLSGRYLRTAAVVGIAMSLGVMASVANAPDEWYWSYLLMVGLHLAVLVLAPSTRPTAPRVMAVLTMVFGVVVAISHAGAGLTGDGNRSWTLFDGTRDVPDQFGRDVFDGSVALGLLLVAVGIVAWLIAGAEERVRTAVGFALVGASVVLLATYGPEGLLLRLGSGASTACILGALGLSLALSRVVTAPPAIAGSTTRE